MGSHLFARRRKERGIEELRQERPTAKVKVKQSDGRIVDIITFK